MAPERGDVILQVHDLLHVAGHADVLTEGPLPSWARQSLAQQAWVVVRRGPAPADLVAVGVRGPQRHERIAALVPAADITAIVCPEDLVDAQDSDHSTVARPTLRTPALAALRAVGGCLGDLGLPWGPVGAVGFELASGQHVTHPGSDLDLIIRAPTLPGAAWAAGVAERLAAIPGAKVDCLVETPRGGVALTEIASGANQLVLRTTNGPRLIEPSPADTAPTSGQHQ